MNDKIKAYKVVTIWGGNSYYFSTIANMCRVMNWDSQQFRNHKSRQEDKEKFIYKDCKVSVILIE